MTLADEEISQLRQWRYYSSLAVFTNTVRGLGKKIYRQWCAEHGPSSAKENVLKLFPRCDSGRWNSTDETEKRILACSQEMLEPVLKRVVGTAILDDRCGPAGATVWAVEVEDASAASLAGENGPVGMEPDQDQRPQKKSKKSAASSASGVLQKVEKNASKKAVAKAPNPDTWQTVDGLSMEESKAFSQKVGKYRRSTLCCIEDPLWWLVIQIMKVCKQPTVHMSAFLKTRFDDRSLAQHGNALARLVHGRAQGFLTEYEQALDSPALSRALERARGVLPDKETRLSLTI